TEQLRPILMKYFLPGIVLLFFNSAAFSQSYPVNIDFEKGDFTNWQTSAGITYSSNGKNVIDLQPTPPMANSHQIISADNNGVIPLDEYGKFPKLCPYGGKYSVKLGNNNVGAEAEGIKYTFIV